MRQEEYYDLAAADIKDAAKLRSQQAIQDELARAAHNAAYERYLAMLLEQNERNALSSERAAVAMERIAAAIKPAVTVDWATLATSVLSLGPMLQGLFEDQTALLKKLNEAAKPVETPE